MFLENIGPDTGLDGRVTPIPRLDYLDPFDVINDRSRSPEDREAHCAGLHSKALEGVPVKDLLRQIYTVDPKMLTRLKDLNYAAVDLEDKE